MLKSRGLTIADESAAKEQLAIISYFRLAGYLRPMEQDKETHTFKPCSTFENAVALYRFDSELRTLLFSAIQAIEIALRAKTIQHIARKHGAFWFMESSLCVSQPLFVANLSRLTAEVTRSKEDFIKEHFAKYSDNQLPPVWKTLELASFGTLSKILENFADNRLKKSIARDFSLPQHLYLESWIKSLCALRNAVAHHARIWNRIIFGHKNSEYLISGHVGDRKGILGEKGITAGFKSAKRQGCTIVVIDLDEHIRQVRPFELSRYISRRKADFTLGLIADCYVVFSGRAVRVNASSQTRIEIQRTIEQLKP